MGRRRRHSRAFKLAAVERFAAASDVRALAGELGITPGLLYKWSTQYRRGGAAALRLPGERAPREAPTSEPSAVAETASCGSACGRTKASEVSVSVPLDVTALQRKVAQQALELDFFRTALRHVGARRRSTGGSGGTGSTP